MVIFSSFFIFTYICIRLCVLLQPPENELQKVGERVPSEHELRVQRSLQRLNVPDWYKNSPTARDGFRLKRHSDASQHGGWRALGSKTTSLSSLSSSSNRQPTTGKTTIFLFCVRVYVSFGNKLNENKKDQLKY